MDFVRHWSIRTEIPVERFIRWVGIGSSKFYDWRSRYGKVNEHNAWVPRDHWLTPQARRAKPPRKIGAPRKRVARGV